MSVFASSRGTHTAPEASLIWSTCRWTGNIVGETKTHVDRMTGRFDNSLGLGGVGRGPGQSNRTYHFSKS